MKVKMLLGLMLLFISTSILAQEKMVTGVISDDTGPLPGVSVLIKGTQKGTETDFNGNYSINTKQGDVLVFSFLGMKTIERTVTSSTTTLSFQMTEDASVLEEVVIVGYGTATKKSFTGTAKTVKTEDLVSKNTSNLSQALAGEVAGVQVINTSGQPGSTSTIRIRGFGSVNGNRSPLYVLDGVPYSGSLNAINPEDIASTTVLKDATATAIYGARGANGVVLITTRAGRKNSSDIEVDVKTGINFSLLKRYDVIQSADQYMQYSWESVYNDGVIRGTADPVAFANANLFSNIGYPAHYNMFTSNNVADIIDPVTRTIKSSVQRKYTPENWRDFAFQPAVRTEANLKFSGGGEKSKYFTSIGYLDDVGYSLNSDYKRYSTRLNLTQDVREWLTSNFNLGYAYSEQNTNGQSSDSGNVFFLVDNMPSVYPLFLRDANGGFVADPIYGGNQYDFGIGREFSGLTNGLADAIYNTRRHNRHELNGNASLTFKFTDDISFKMQYGLQYNNRIYRSYANPFYGSGRPNKGSLFMRFRESLTQNVLQLLRYKKQFGDHNINAILAHESNSNDFREDTDSKNGVVVPGLLELNNFINGAPGSSYKDESRLESYFTQVNYNYKQTYFLSASLRRDGSSRFVNNKWDNFGSIGASWVMSNEEFLKNQKIVDFLKLKASYGLVGEQSGVGLYPGLNLFNINNQNNEISISPDVIGNPDLTWETSKMFQVGAEVQFGKYVDANFDYYIKNTDNLLFNRRAPIGLGFAILTVNDGKLRNSGFEFDVTTHIVNKDDFKLDFAINGEFLTNELTAMPIDPSTGKQKILDVNGAANYGRAAGKSLYDFYLREWAGVDPADGAPMWVANYYDANGNGVFDGNDAEKITSLYDYRIQNPDREIKTTVTKNYANATEKFVGKTAIPKLRGAFRLGGSYKNFDFSTQFMYSLGGYGYDGAYASLMHSNKVGSNNWHTDISQRWQKPGDITNVPRLSNGQDNRANSSSTRFLVKTDFLSLNNVRVGYTLPTEFAQKAGVSNVRLWVSGDNLFLLSARKGFNPSTSETGTSSVYRYSPLSNFTLGVRVKF